MSRVVCHKLQFVDMRSASGGEFHTCLVFTWWWWITMYEMGKQLGKKFSQWATGWRWMMRHCQKKKKWTLHKFRNYVIQWKIPFIAFTWQFSVGVRRNVIGGAVTRTAWTMRHCQKWAHDFKQIEITEKWLDDTSTFRWLYVWVIVASRKFEKWNENAVRRTNEIGWTCEKL